jgi:hypothetical protein
MSVSLIERVGTFFARDKEAYWWKLVTDYERSLSKMSLSELASELQRTQVRYETANTIIVEHMLAARLARIQSRASWWSGWFGFAGAMLAAALTFYLGQRSADLAAKVESATVQKSEEKPVQKPVQAVIPEIKQNLCDPKAVQPHERNGNGKLPNTPSKP